MLASNIKSDLNETPRQHQPRPLMSMHLLAGARVCACQLASEPGPAGDIVLLRVVGDVDMLTLPTLQGALTAAAERHPGDLVIDLAAVGFCSVRGFALLAAAECTAQTRGTGYALSGLSPHLDRVATLLEFEKRCVRYRSVAAAVSAIRVEHTYRVA